MRKVAGACSMHKPSHEALRRPFSRVHGPGAMVGGSPGTAQHQSYLTPAEHARRYYMKNQIEKVSREEEEAGTLSS